MFPFSSNFCYFLLTVIFPLGTVFDAILIIARKNLQSLNFGFFGVSIPKLNRMVMMMMMMMD